MSRRDSQSAGVAPDASAASASATQVQNVVDRPRGRRVHDPHHVQGPRERARQPHSRVQLVHVRAPRKTGPQPPAETLLLPRSGKQPCLGLTPSGPQLARVRIHRQSHRKRHRLCKQRPRPLSATHSHPRPRAVGDGDGDGDGDGLAGPRPPCEFGDYGRAARGGALGACVGGVSHPKQAPVPDSRGVRPPRGRVAGVRLGRAGGRRRRCGRWGTDRNLVRAPSSDKSVGE